MFSSVASKLHHKTDQGRWAHINLQFESAIPADARGIFAEFAGVRPLSPATEALLKNPKMTTLISTANMHLKQTNPAVAAEIYSRLLQDANVPNREREVAQRKLAECEKLLKAKEEARLKEEGFTYHNGVLKEFSRWRNSPALYRSYKGHKGQVYAFKARSFA